MRGQRDMPSRSREYTLHVRQLDTSGAAAERDDARSTRERVSDAMGFTGNGGNVIAAGDVDMGLTVRALGALSGIEFDRHSTRVINHFGCASMPPSAVSGVGAVTSRLLLGSYLDGGAA
ncbi:unnamed protein product [Phaeothamnion confervicola]